MKKQKLNFKRETLRALTTELAEVRGGSPPSKGMGECQPSQRISVCITCDLTIGKCSVICI